MTKMKSMNGPISLFGSAISVQQLFVNLLLVSFITAKPSNRSNFTKVYMSPVEIIRNFGYPSEIHKVVTEDGYILELHRISGSKSGQLPTRNYPVLFHHAFLSTSAEWVGSGPNSSLAMQLADAGYDVWLANCRGNTYSNKHVSLNVKQKAFWNFSFHEIGKYDLPAAIDYILMKTNNTQIHYVGYSMGTCVFFIMASERPEYQPKIRSQFSLAPVAYLRHTTTPIRYLASYLKPMAAAYQKVSTGMMFQRSILRSNLVRAVCGTNITQRLFCLKGFINAVAGNDPHLFNTNLIPIFILHYPSGTSFKTVMHFAQLLTKGTFTQFDYGPVKNMRYYNATKPPNYDLKSIQVPITMFYGLNDKVADVKDVMSLKAELPKLIDVILVNNTYCNHLDFLFSLKVNEHVNDPIKEILRKTDDPNWVYTGPRTRVVREIGNDVRENPDKPTPDPVTDRNGSSVSNYLAENFDAIMADTLPRLVIDDDMTIFKQERESQKILLSNTIEFLKTVEKKYGLF